MITAASPRQWSMPAAIATWLPKLRGKRIARTRGSDAPQPFEHRERSVAAAVVDEDELPVVVAERAHDVVHRVVERAEVVVLVEHRHDDGDERSSSRSPRHNG